MAPGPSSTAGQTPNSGSSGSQALRDFRLALFIAVVFLAPVLLADGLLAGLHLVDRGVLVRLAAGLLCPPAVPPSSDYSPAGDTSDQHTEGRTRAGYRGRPSARSARWCPISAQVVPSRRGLSVRAHQASGPSAVVRLRLGELPGPGGGPDAGAAPCGQHLAAEAQTVQLGGESWFSRMCGCEAPRCAVA